MTPDPSRLSLVAPLVLRLALASIFIFHGVQKIWPPENIWGAAWAEQLWGRQLKVPRDVLLKLEQMAPEIEEDPEATAEFLSEVKDKFAVLYARESGRIPDSLRFPAAQLAVAWGELAGGLLILAGVLTRLAALGLIVIQIGAIATVTWTKGFSFAGGGGYEYNLALIAMCLTLALLGGGVLSIDRWAVKWRRATAAAKKEPPVPAAVG